MESEEKFRIKIYRHRDGEREVIAECLLNFPPGIDSVTVDAKGKMIGGKLNLLPKITGCKPELSKKEVGVVEIIEVQLADEFRSQGKKAIIDRYKYPAGAEIVDDYSWTIETLK